MSENGKLDDLRSKGDPTTILLIELISKVIENANAVSGSIRLHYEITEELVEAVKRLETKYDDVIKSLDTSGIIRIFNFFSKISGKIWTAVIVAFAVPLVMFMLSFLLSLYTKGFPFIVKLGGH